MDGFVHPLFFYFGASRNGIASGTFEKRLRCTLQLIQRDELIFCKDLVPSSIQLFPACVSDELLNYMVAIISHQKPHSFATLALETHIPVHRHFLYDPITIFTSESTTPSILRQLSINSCSSMTDLNITSHKRLNRVFVRYRAMIRS